MSDEAVKTWLEDGIFTLELDRPKANAINLETSRAMGEAFKRFRDTPEARVAIVKTAGEKFFSAGWDLKAAADGDSVVGDYGVGGFAGLQELPNLNKPVIAAVQGMAVGGGFELMLSCDLIYCTDSSTFALPEIKAGTLADSATIRLPKNAFHITSPWRCCTWVAGWTRMRLFVGGWLTKALPTGTHWMPMSSKLHGCWQTVHRWFLPASRKPHAKLKVVVSRMP